MSSQALTKLTDGLRDFANTTVRTKVSASIRCNTPNCTESSHRSITLKGKCKLWKMLLVVALFISFCVIKHQFKE